MKTFRIYTENKNKDANALATETKKINETEQYLLICKVTEITKCIVLDCSSLAVRYTKELLEQLERLKGV